MCSRVFSVIQLMKHGELEFMELWLQLYDTSSTQLHRQNSSFKHL